MNRAEGDEGEEVTGGAGKGSIRYEGQFAGSWLIAKQDDVSANKFETLEEKLAFGWFDRGAAADKGDEDGFKTKESNFHVIFPAEGVVNDSAAVCFWIKVG